MQDFIHYGVMSFLVVAGVSLLVPALILVIAVFITIGQSIATASAKSRQRRMPNSF